MVRWPTTLRQHAIIAILRLFVPRFQPLASLTKVNGVARCIITTRRGVSLGRLLIMCSVMVNANGIETYLHKVVLSIHSRHDTKLKVVPNGLGIICAFFATTPKSYISTTVSINKRRICQWQM